MTDHRWNGISGKQTAWPENDNNKLDSRMKYNAGITKTKTKVQKVSSRHNSNQAKSILLSCYKIVKNFVPALLLICYAAVGAGIIYGTENYAGQTVYDHQIVNNCVSNGDFWTAFYYVNTLYTTIGYGNVIACTDIGRFFSVLIAVIGIPLMFIVLNGTGKWLGMLMNRLFLIAAQSAEFIQEKRLGKLQKKSLIDEWTHITNDDQPIHVPIYLGILMTFAWILICAGYFSLTEHWSYSQALYFSFISLTTVGLGDLAPERHNLTILSFTAIMIGLTLVSMSIKVIQAHIEHVFVQMAIEIQSDKGRQSTESGGENDFMDPALSTNSSEQQERPRSNFHNKQYLQALLSQRQLAALDKLYQKKTRSRMRGIQATARMDTRGTNPVDLAILRDDKGSGTTSLMMIDKRCQTDPPSTVPTPRSTAKLSDNVKHLAPGEIYHLPTTIHN